MKNRSLYWLGLGSGLIIGAILMQLMSIGDQTAMDLDDLRKASARYGYRLVTDDEVVRIVNEEHIRAIYILPEMTLEQIAELLTGVGLISSEDVLLDEFHKLSPQPVISSGHYEFVDQPSVYEIIELLTDTVPKT